MMQFEPRIRFVIDLRIERAHKFYVRQIFFITCLMLCSSSIHIALIPSHHELFWAQDHCGVMHTSCHAFGGYGR